MHVKNTYILENPVLFNIINADTGLYVGEIELTLTQAERFIKVLGDDYRLEQAN